MKAFRNFLIACLIVVLGYYLLLRPALNEAQPTRAAALQMDSAPMPTATLQPLHTPTASPMPSPTIGYQATAYNAQQTADAYARLMVDATMTSASMTQAADIWTVTAEYERAVALGYTAQAEQTFVPVTYTAQAVSLTAQQADRNALGTQMAMTVTAPTQIVALARSQNEAAFGWWWGLGSVVALFGVGLGFAGLAVFALRRRPAPVETGAGQGAESERPEVRVTLQRGVQFPQVDHLSVPCSAAQLKEMAFHVANDPNLAVNRWDKIKDGNGGMLFSRAQFAQMREFLTANGLATRSPSGVVVLAEDGLDFFEDVRNLSDAPLPFRTAPQNAPTDGEINHSHENHAHDNGGGGVFEAFSA